MNVRAPQCIAGTARAFFGHLQCSVIKIRQVPFRALELFINNASKLLAQLLQDLVILWNTLANRLQVKRSSLTNLLAHSLLIAWQLELHAPKLMLNISSSFSYLVPALSAADSLL